jgi:hypothetical protein
LRYPVSPAATDFLDDLHRRRFFYGYGKGFSSQEISLVATDGSGSTTLAGTEFVDDENVVGLDDDDEERAFLRWYMTASSAFVRGSPASPPASSQSMAALGCARIASPSCVPTRVERLRREFRHCRGTATSAVRSASCHSEPEVVRCCAASTAAVMAAPRVDVSAWRRQFRRRKAITLADLNVDQALIGSCRRRGHRSSSVMSAESVILAAAAAAAGGRSFSQRSAVTQQR